MSVSPEAKRWLGEHVRAFAGYDRGVTHAVGRVVGYCDAPQVLIETEDGEKVDWRADLCEVLEERPEPKPSWERGLERIRQGEERERERRNHSKTWSNAIVTSTTFNLTCDPSDLLRFMARAYEAQFRQRYAAAMGEGDEEQWEVFI